MLSDAGFSTKRTYGLTRGRRAARLVVPTPVNGTVPPHRKPNSETRDREHLTEAEVERLMKTAGENRYGHRDATMPSGMACGRSRCAT